MNPGEHPPRELLAGYRARTLSAEQLEAVTGHFADCAECRVAVQKLGDQEKLAQAFDMGDPHLSYEELEKCVEANGSAHPHLARCEMCAGEWRDLKAFRDSLRQKPERRRLRVIVPALVTMAAALALVMLPKHHAAAPAPPVTAPVAAIRDGGRTISVDAAGALHGVDSADETLKSLVAGTLRTGKLPVSTGMFNLMRNKETMLGSGDGQAAMIAVASPVGTVSVSGEPNFTWDAQSDAGRFIVSVYSTDFRLVAQSGELSSHEWKCTTALKAGAVYLWTVSGVVAGKRVTEPSAPEPEARFRVASAAEADEFRAALQVRPTSDLAIAVVAAKLGMRQEAQAALSRLSALNPGSDLPSRLAAGIRPQAK